MRTFIPIIILLCSITSSAQWTQSQLGDAQIGYNIFSTGTEVYAATLNGVYKTTDNGNPWFNIGMQSRLVFDVIKSGQYILAATENIGPGVYRSSDNGSTWLETTGMANQSVRAFTKNSSYIFACTWGGGVFRSNDDGGTWESVGLTNVGFRSIYSAGEIIFAGADKVYFSTNNGNSWESRQLPYPGGDAWCFHYVNGVLYAGDMGLYISTDMGNSWQLKYGVTFDNQGNAIDVKIFKDILSYNNVLIASIAFNSIYTSIDGGTNWSEFNDGLMSDWTFTGLAINVPYIWALRDFFGNAYYRPLTSITEVTEKDFTLLNNNYHLSQNFPNPFNPVTTISWQSPVGSHQTLKVYDILGNEVVTLIDEFKPAGRYEVKFDASGLSSGMYFYTLQSGSFTETKKMILLK